MFNISQTDERIKKEKKEYKIVDFRLISTSKLLKPLDGCRTHFLITEDNNILLLDGLYEL